MSTPPDWSRRTLLSTSALAGLGSLAGCLGSAADVPGLARTTTDDRAGIPSADAQCPTDFLDGANGYEGETKRYGPGSEPTVTVGASPDGSDAHDMFEPVVIRVVPGTTVTWLWTGYGGPHNVVAVDGSFDSGESVAASGTHFERTFSEPGTYRYVSEPNRSEGMRGVVEVAEPPSGEYPAVDEWLASVEGYDGTVPDRREQPRVTITVGSAAGPDAFDFAPPAVKISPGTTVTWVWSGDGGPHNVAFEDRDIRLDTFEPEPGVHLEHTFETAGIYRYSCEPHESIGQRGALVVEEPSTD
jgi:halocyanin-like protein